MFHYRLDLTIDRGLDTAEGGLGVEVVALGAGDISSGQEGVSTVGQLVTPALIAPDTLSCDTTVSTQTSLLLPYLSQ